MSEKLLELGNDFTIDNLVNRVNEIVGEKFSAFDENNNIEKWNSIPKMFILEDDIQNKILEFVSYMDSLLIAIEKKALYVISLAGIIEFTKIMITNYDSGDLFLLADYYENKTIDEIKNTIIITSNKNLLTAIRTKTLDLDVRKKLISGCVNQIINNKIDINNSQQLLSFIQEYIEKLSSIDSKELVG